MNPFEAEPLISLDKTSIVGMFVILLMVLAFFRLVVLNKGTEDQLKAFRTPEFTSFQRNYLFVYFLALLGDWLQGPYLYSLYHSYGYSQSEIGALFAMGFVSSLVFGTFVGSLADKLGRRLMCQVFGVIYGLCCVTKVYNNYQILMLGRWAGGIATSLLFSVFEAWMVSEHHSRRFHADLIGDTFAKATFGNGVIAVCAGLIATVAVEYMGYAGPFVVAGAPLFLITFVVSFWPENYGSAGTPFSEQMSNGFQALVSEARIARLGFAQACFEGGMYLFVILWVPALEGSSMDDAEDLPFGLIFAVFMVGMMIGSCVFEWRGGAGSTGYMHLVAICAFTVALFQFDFKFLVFLMFVVYEACVGAFFPAYGTLRSIYIGEEVRATVMNLIRVPLNVLVVAVLMNADSMTTEFQWFLVVAINVVSWLCYSSFSSIVEAKKVVKHTQAEAKALVSNDSV